MTLSDDDVIIDLTQEVVSPHGIGPSFGALRVVGKPKNNLFRTVYLYRWVVFVGLIIGGVVGFGFSAAVPPIYKGTTLIRLGHSGTKVNGDVAVVPDSELVLPLEVKIALIKSREVARRVLKSNRGIIDGLESKVSTEESKGSKPLSSQATEGLNDEPDIIPLREVSRYLKHISFIHNVSSDTVSLSFEANDAVLASRIANIHSQEFVEVIAEKQSQLIDGSLSRFKNQEEDVRSRYLEINTRSRTLRSQIEGGFGSDVERAKWDGELQILEQRLIVERENLVGLQKRIEQGSYLSKSGFFKAEVIDSALPNFTPISVNGSVVCLIGGAIGGALAFIFSLWKASLDLTINSVTDCAGRFGHTFLGAVPSLSKDTKRAIRRFAILRESRKAVAEGYRKRGLSFRFFLLRRNSKKLNAPILLAAPFSPECEAVRSIATNVSHQALFGRKNIVLFTSSGTKEGKSFLAVNTAIALAQMHKRTLLIDADLRQPRVHEFFGFDRVTNGLFDFAIGVSEMSDLVIESPVENLNLILSGSPAPFLSNLITEHDRIHSGIRNLCSLFDAIIIDSPGIDAVADPLLLAQTAHSVVVVARYNKSTYHDTQFAIERLNQLGAVIAGIALNDVD